MTEHRLGSLMRLPVVSSNNDGTEEVLLIELDERRKNITPTQGSAALLPAS